MSVNIKSMRRNGFTLVEVLVAVVIFGVGLLTVASLQVVARKANYEAVQHTTAAHLAQSMLERMRANRTVLNFYVGATGETVLGGGEMAEPANQCLGTTCDVFEVAAADLWEWEQLLDGSYEVAADGSSVGGLVSPTACIRGPTATLVGVYSVSIAWRGTTEILDDVGDDCGLGDPDYGAGGSRRVMTVRTFIN